MAVLKIPDLPPGAYHLHVEIPLLREARPGFGAECRLRLDDVEAPLVEADWPNTGRVLAAHLKVVDPSSELELLTPEPALLPAAERRAAEPASAARPRGIAVPVERVVPALAGQPDAGSRKAAPLKGRRRA